MASGSVSVKRVEKPLKPENSVLVVGGDKIFTLDAENITQENVGLKAFGLASLPAAWTRPFFVIQHGVTPTLELIQQALAERGIRADEKLILRSSGVDESMERRGALESAESSASQLTIHLASLRKALEAEGVAANGPVHWVVQQLVPTLAKGHLSNERRMAEQKRDWIAEVEASSGYPVETKPISLRTWRDNRLPQEGRLACPYREQYTSRLAEVARWAYERLIRLHFEWVWDGHAIYIVQADACDDVTDGVSPKDLVQVPLKGKRTFTQLKVFREVTSADYEQYRKLANARLYRGLGYQMVPFYVMDDAAEIQLLIQNGTCSQELLHDLRILVARPLVIRSDGQNVPSDLKQMLPRSEELRSVEAAKDWLIDSFRAKALQKTENSNIAFADCFPCLIAHHYVPATAAAWCQAKPDQRRVRIESLWGLPEGLYWYAYDAYDVDTQVSVISSGQNQPSAMKIHARKRYKERFIAPDEQGRWVLHKTATGFDWQRSIKRTEWIEEIAWASRKIAAEVGHPVVVMWFVDVPNSVSSHHVLPWYHEEWMPGASPHKAAPRRKLSSSTDFVLRVRADWETLKTRIANGDQIVRVKVQPDEPDIVRDRKFAEELAVFANQNKLVVELEGGVLSHAYYMLSRAGCTVECADLDDYATDDLELEFNKLVRDKIPSSIAGKGESVIVHRLVGEALIASLRRKLVEESLEVLDARTAEDMAEELADVREVVLALMNRIGIAEAEVERRRKKKADGKGAFNEALMLSKTAVVSATGFKEMEVRGDDDQLRITSTIDQVLSIPSSIEDIHVDRRLDETGTAERQFTVDVPAHVSGYQPSRILFQMPTQGGEVHDMVFELLLSRKGADLRVRARIINVATQLELDLGDKSNGVDSKPRKAG